MENLHPAGKKLDPQINEQFEKACDEFYIKDKELDESRESWKAL